MNFKPNSKTKGVLKVLREFIETVEDKFYFVVMGGIAVDGYIGKITRDHSDVDMLVFREDLEEAEHILEKLGLASKRFMHPTQKEMVYKVQTGDEDHLLSFQVLDKVGKDKFEISFFREPHLIYSLSYIYPPVWLSLEGVRFPAVQKEFLIIRKESEVEFFEKLKKEDLQKYQLKRKTNHLKCLHDLALLKAI